MPDISARWCGVVFVVGMLLLPGAQAQGNDSTSRFDVDWVTIGAPGNAPTPADLYVTSAPREVGRVDYEYRIARTEVTNGQWLEFVQAFQPFNSGSLTSAQLTGLGVQFVFGEYVLAEPAEWPASMSWENAARYANWLTNDKALSNEAFQRGAYDTSTFTRNPDGTFNHQLTHSPGASVWIPSEDEWVKAAFYDPNRFGVGVGGYWMHPGSQDDLLVSGSPDLGGQTNAGLGGGPRAVGSYPNVQSPWGLLDISGGKTEWLETTTDPFSRNRRVRGSRYGDELYSLRDPIENSVAFGPTATFVGLRLAGTIPAPSSFCAALLYISLIGKRQKRKPRHQRHGRVPSRLAPQLFPVPHTQIPHPRWEMAR